MSCCYNKHILVAQLSRDFKNVFVIEQFSRISNLKA